MIPLELSVVRLKEHSTDLASHSLMIANMIVVLQKKGKN